MVLNRDMQAKKKTLRNRDILLKITHQRNSDTRAKNNTPFKNRKRKVTHFEKKDSKNNTL